MMKIVGHRGARGLAPENTVLAMKKALEHRVDEIEIDVRITKDSIPIVHHDGDVQDASGARMPIKHHTYDELKAHKPDLATLAEIIEAIDRKVPLQMEVKWGQPTLPIIRLIQIYLTRGWHENDFLFGSKSQRTLMELHRAIPSVPTVVIEPFSGVRASWRARQLDTRRLSMNYRWLWRGFVSPLARRGYELHAYTLDQPRTARQLARFGLTGIVTDYPDLYNTGDSKIRHRSRNRK